MQRAYSLLQIKSLDEEQRIIEGIATTPSTDRMGDIVEPTGAEFKLPVPLLWQHNSREPIGHVTKASVTPEGITVRAQISTFNEPGKLKDLLDFAWQSIKSGLVRGLSIGFNSIADEPIKGTFGVRFLQWEWLELSAVTIPANMDASIAAVKSCDTNRPASTGTVTRSVPPGASGSIKFSTLKSREGTMKTYAEQIKDLEATRAARSARREEIQKKVNEDGRSKDAAEREEFDTIGDELKSIDAEITDLRALEKDAVANAKPVVGTKSDEGTNARGTPIVTVHRANLPKGTGFTRYAMAMASGRGSVSDALRYAERWKDSTPEVLEYIRHKDRMHTKAEPGTTTDDVYGWAGPLVYAQNLVSEFVDLLRPATILGKLTGIRNVPFNVRIPVQTGGSTVGWVGEAAPKPVTSLQFDAISLGYHKVAGIVVLTDELVRLSTPSAEEAVRRDLVEQTVRFIDAQFIDPSVSVSANNPASITNGVSASGASGTDAEALYADLNGALATFDDTDLGTNSMYVLMRPGTARGIAALRNALGQFEFTGLTPAGGTLMGFPVIVSNSVPSGYVILVKADEILLADDGNVTLDASREATLDMNGGESPNFNLWQKNCVGIRAERGLTWVKRRPDAVAVINNAAYGPVSGS